MTRASRFLVAVLLFMTALGTILNAEKVSAAEHRTEVLTREICELRRRIEELRTTMEKISGEQDAPS